MVGGLVTAVGIVLLVLPGPGFVLVAAGLAILAREFEWAARPLRIARNRADIGLMAVAHRPLAAALDAAAGVVIAGLAIADLIVGLPLLNPVGDWFMLGSGLFLVWSIGYARTSPRYRSGGPVGRRRPD